MRISKKNENNFRKKSNQSATTPWPQTSDDRLRFYFPKTARLLSKVHYQRVSRSGNRFFGDFVTIDYYTGESKTPRLGITVSRRFGKAHERNRFKRVVREAFRLALPSLPKNLEINVLPKGPLPSSPASVSKDIHSLLGKVNAESGARKSG